MFFCVWLVSPGTVSPGPGHGEQVPVLSRAEPQPGACADFTVLPSPVQTRRLPLASGGCDRRWSRSA